MCVCERERGRERKREIVSLTNYFLFQLQDRVGSQDGVAFMIIPTVTVEEDSS